MHTVNKIIQTSITDHMQLIQEITETFAPIIEQVVTVMMTSLSNGGGVFWYGNGGSAADAQHMAAELVGRFKRNRHALRSLALTTDTSILTALGNDYGFDAVFIRQVQAHVKPSDVCIGISTSGNSNNVFLAHQEAQKIGAHTVSLLGGDGGRIKSVSNYALVVPSCDTPRIQEMHTFIGHVMCDVLEQTLAAVPVL